MIHYILGGGSFGCLYDYCGVYRRAIHAVEFATELYDLTNEQAAELTDNDQVRLTPEQGADYCEVTFCDCSEPWTHIDGGTADDWPDIAEPDEIADDGEVG